MLTAVFSRVFGRRLGEIGEKVFRVECELRDFDRTYLRGRRFCLFFVFLGIWCGNGVAYDWCVVFFS